MLALHGALWLQLRADDPVAQRARRVAQWTGVILMTCFALAGLWVSFGLHGYRIVSDTIANAVSNPMAKQVTVSATSWLVNYQLYPWMVLAPSLGFVGIVVSIMFSRVNRPGLGILSSGVAITGIILTAGFSLFPFIMPSSSVPDASLTVWDATSSHHTLTIMFWAALVFVPIVLSYTIWSYRALWGRVTLQQVQQNTHSIY